MTSQWQTSPEPGWTPPPQIPPTQPPGTPSSAHPAPSAQPLHPAETDIAAQRQTMVAVDGHYLEQHRAPGAHELDMHTGGGQGRPEGYQRAGDPDGPADQDVKKERDPVTRFLIEWVPLMIGAMLFAFLVRSFLFTAYEIPSQSMVPTLNISDRVIVNRMSYNFHDINRGDVIVFNRPPNLAGDTDVLIKRVVGLPGETVTLRDGNVYIDDMLMVESYIADQDSTFSLGPLPGCVQQSNNVCTVPEDHVLVMGDNRYKSSDGRVFGPIPVDEIVGRAFVKIWPLSDIGGL